MSETLISSAWNVLRAIYPTLPLDGTLRQESEDAGAAQGRGYFLPDEDERLREVYGRYLKSRVILHEIVTSLTPRLKEPIPLAFCIAFGAATALARSSGALIAIAKDRPVVHQKLDEAEPRYDIPRKTFTAIYRSATSPGLAWRYHQAWKYYHQNREEIITALSSEEFSGLVELLDGDPPLFLKRKRSFWTSIMEYRLHSLNRRTHSSYHKVMFHLFRISGSAIAGKLQPFTIPKGSSPAVGPEIVRRMEGLLRPGDIIVTRHHHALSNLFLPGHWPHAAFYLGTPAQRKALDLLSQGAEQDSVLEAKKDGVKLRPLRETLSVDAFLVLRPVISTPDLARVITRALTHEGKLYDFLFDFKKSERLACTEVVYRSFHGIGNWQFQLVKQSGRLTLPAEELIKQCLQARFAKVYCVFGARNCPLTFGKEAAEILEESLQK